MFSYVFRFDIEASILIRIVCGYKIHSTFFHTNTCISGLKIIIQNIWFTSNQIQKPRTKKRTTAPHTNIVGSWLTGLPLLVLDAPVLIHILILDSLAIVGPDVCKMCARAIYACVISCGKLHKSHQFEMKLPHHIHKKCFHFYMTIEYHSKELLYVHFNVCFPSIKYIFLSISCVLASLYASSHIGGIRSFLLAFCVQSVSIVLYFMKLCASNKFVYVMRVHMPMPSFL